MKDRVYFVSYAYTKKDASGFGNCMVTRNSAIKSYADISDMAKAIGTVKDSEDMDIIILNWRLFE